MKPYTCEREKGRNRKKQNLKRSELEVVRALLIFPTPFASKN